MKTIKTLGLVSLAILAIGAMSASAASAYEWQINGAALTSPAAVKWTSTIEFENTEEADNFACTMVHAGTVGRGQKAKSPVSPAAAAPNLFLVRWKNLVFAESNVEVEAQGLPWKTELVVVNGVLRNKYTAEPPVEGDLQNARRTKTGKRRVTCLLGVGPHNVSGGVEEINDSSSASTGCFRRSRWRSIHHARSRKAHIDSWNGEYRPRAARVAQAGAGLSGQSRRNGQAK